MATAGGGAQHHGQQQLHRTGASYRAFIHAKFDLATSSYNSNVLSSSSKEFSHAKSYASSIFSDNVNSEGTAKQPHPKSGSSGPSSESRMSLNVPLSAGAASDAKGAAVDVMDTHMECSKEYSTEKDSLGQFSKELRALAAAATLCDDRQSGKVDEVDGAVINPLQQNGGGNDTQLSHDQPPQHMELEESVAAVECEHLSKADDDSSDRV